MKKSLYRQARRLGRPMRTVEQIDIPNIQELKKVEVIHVDKGTECHVTPPDVSARMVEYLEAAPDKLTIEPHIGSGNLIHALLESGHSIYEITAIERNTVLWNSTRNRFLERGLLAGFNRCFLEYAAEAKGNIVFPSIICNPPFRQIKKHMNAAIDLLGLGGHDVATLVALVPITYEHREAETMEVLPVDTFSTAPGIRTKIIRIDR